MGIRVWENGDRWLSRKREMGRIAEQGDTEGAVRFHDFLFKSGQILILTCYCFFSAGPTTGPHGASASTLKLTLIYERRREAEGGGWKGKGKWESEGGEDTDERTGTPFLPISLHYSFSSVLFFNFSSFFCFLSSSTSADRDMSSSERL